jgi:hypothetical protein
MPHHSKIDHQMTRWVKRFTSTRHRHSPDVRFGPKATGLMRHGETSLRADTVAKVQNYPVMIFWP